MPTVLITDHPTGDLAIERELFDAEGIQIVMAPDTSEGTLARIAAEVDAVMVCYAQVPATVVEAAARNKCRVIARYGIGFDNVDVASAARFGIPVTNVPDYCVEEVADHALALLLSCARAVVTGAEAVRAGGWAIDGMHIPRLRGKRLALVGVGRIGSAVAERALAFGLELVGYDPVAVTWAKGVERLPTLEAAVSDADFVSLHAPLSAGTRHLVDAALLRKVTRAPILVNTSRGGLVDHDALLTALDDGAVSWAALDVVEPEPLPPDHPLRHHPRVTLTPHIAFTSSEANGELQRKAVDEVLRALDGRPPRSPVTA